MRDHVDLREAVNAVSDVVQNRPKPLREFDQIHMKVGDMVLQTEIVADWADGKRLAFIGDGDAISVCVAYMRARNVFDFGPSKITVFDFDERTVQAVRRFADRERVEHLDAELYNCLEAFPDMNKYDCFYTNPPWGASNQGESVNVFVQRGMEAIKGDGDGMIVIADDDELVWPKQVLGNVQRFAGDRGFYVSRMQPKLHGYHLDDAPNLKSCNLFISSVPNLARVQKPSQPISKERLANFYGMSKEPRVRYVREKKRPDYGKAPQDEYFLDYLEDAPK
ncbi:bis-aminopropyl spermidine synthase family protein [Bradyrhizobium centrosematis]|uniref:bis-aminopropyl spermidine synthase family protein n=1 Tax=Bradyrhizobium centrosematis TaxID=1300039 RepID=UPI0021688D9A|nr:bis-aminopropyl spermidine synthase family protein [Bradyrhizobium centrosematis]MCS3761593.1 putative methyltransferase [Bradyrhizobium centrosematis]MCS3774261.1 putative methyltransferase [Bradyrhizobium centrosematis]